MLFLLEPGNPDKAGAAMSAVEVKLGANGSIRLPAELRQKLGIQPGDTLLVDATDDGLLIWTRALAATGLKELVSRSVPDTTSLVDELRAMRGTENDSLERRAQTSTVRSGRGRS